MIKEPATVKVKNIEKTAVNAVSLCLHKFFKPSDNKNIILFISILVLTSSCNQTGEKTSTNLNENYSKNLATAQKFFDLFLTEESKPLRQLVE